ncbi:MAG: FMN-binding protein [Desulfomonilaceae bacterium]|nr:FMN-binding protein [Desulfomonilaceae bacterium]
MKEIFKITLSLTCVCIAAALILGAVYTQTEHIRKEQEEKTERQTIQSLLGYGPGKEIPADLNVFSIHRYVINTADAKTMLGYVLPLKDKGHVLAEIELSGKPGKVIPLEGKESEIAERASRDKIVNDALPDGWKAVWAQTLYVANLGDKRLGYVVPGVTQGFKTFIHLMVSLDPDFTVTGIAITESEEDPGLGAEIEQGFFRNQFVGKTQDVLRNLKVVKEPLPDDYFRALEPAKAKRAGMTPEQVREARDKYLKADIYALTGATISSVAVTVGVKDAVRKFVYRIDILNDAIKQDNVQVAF